MLDKVSDRLHHEGSALILLSIQLLFQILHLLLQRRLYQLHELLHMRVRVHYIYFLHELD